MTVKALICNFSFIDSSKFIISFIHSYTELKIVEKQKITKLSGSLNIILKHSQRKHLLGDTKLHIMTLGSTDLEWLSIVRISCTEIKRQDNIDLPLGSQHQRVWRVERQTSINHIDMFDTCGMHFKVTCRKMNIEWTLVLLSNKILLCGANQANIMQLIQCTNGLLYLFISSMGSCQKSSFTAFLC